MSGGPPEHPDELQDLLQFLYMCPVGLISFNDDGTIVHINPEAVSVIAPALGVAEFDNVFSVFARSWPELEALVADPQHGIGRLVEDHRFEGSVPSSRWLSATLVRVTEGHSMLVVADVSALVASEADFHESEGRLQSVFDSIDEGFCLCEMVVDDAGSPQDYRFLKVNPLFEEMTGLVNPVGKTALELVPDLERSWVDSYARVGLGGETLRFEQGSAAMDRWFDVFATPVPPRGHFAIVFKDVSQRREAEETLRARAVDDAYRAALTDSLRSIADTTEVEHRAASMLGERLNAVRVHYADIDRSGRVTTVRAGYHSAGLHSDVVQHQVDYGPMIVAELRARRTVVVTDVAGDPRLSTAHRAAMLELGIGSYALVPTSEQSNLVGTLVVYHSEPRSWSRRDLNLVEETAERTRSALDRLLAE